MSNTNALQAFMYEGTQVSIVMRDGEPWWVLKDVCNVLGIGNVTDTANRLDDDEKAEFDSAELSSNGVTQVRKRLIINEPSLYNVVLRSKKSEAKQFRKWITSEVLPSIRKHGAYMTPTTIESLVANPDLIIELAQKLKAVQEAHKEAVLLLEEKAVELDESQSWLTIKRVAAVNGIRWNDISWRRLKNSSDYMQYDVKKIFDANYGAVNSYHIDVWRHEYPEFSYSVSSVYTENVDVAKHWNNAGLVVG